MPDPFFHQEFDGVYTGLFNQPSVPGALPRSFSTLMHNMSLTRGMPHTRAGRQRLNGALLGGGGGGRTVYGLAIWRTSPVDDLIVACGNKLQSMPVTGGDPTTLTTSYPTGYRTSPTGARTSMAQLGNRLFIVNGVDANVKYNGTALTRMGQASPATLSAPSKSAGSLTGTFKYRARLVTSAANGSYESEPTATLTVSYTAEQGTFSAPAVPSSDPQVDRWNLERAAAGGSTFFKVNTSPVTLATTIVDTLTDAVLTNSALSDDLLVDSPPPGIFKLLTVHQGRLVGVTTAEPNTLYWSDLGITTAGIFPKPESWPPRNRLVFGENGGTAITGMVSFFNWLVVFQNFGTWSIRGDMSSDGRVIEPVLVAPDNRGVGISDIGNIAHAENKIIFAAKDGLYVITRDVGAVTSDLAVRCISKNIDEMYQQIDFGSGGVSTYDRDHRRWMFWGKGAA